MADFNDLFPSGPPTKGPVPDTTLSADGMAAATGDYSDEELLELWVKIKREAIDPRMIFLKQWHHHVLYFLSRQWIEFFGYSGGWRDKRLALGTPRPVTNLLKKAVDTIRALFTSVQLGVMVRPNGADPKNVAAAATADELAPLLHDAHHMNTVLAEFDFWLLVCANAFLYTFLDYDIKYGTVTDPSQTCSCGAVSTTSQITDAGMTCPECGQPGPFTPTLGDDGQPMLNERPKGQPTTIPLSPLEVAFSNAYSRFDDLPYIVRLRWRTKTYYEDHPELKHLVPQIKWERGSGDLSLQLFKTLSQHNDLGISNNFSRYVGTGSMGTDQEDGITEYEVHYKPCDAYPKGLVFRIAGDKGIVLHLEDTEAIPGPLPYTDAAGTPLFTFAHAAYEQVGGRVLGAGIFDIASQKQDQINQLDSMLEMIAYRVGNPIWLRRKGSVQFKLTGTVGVIVDYDDPFGDGRGKPERVPGIDISPGWFTYREQLINDFEDLVGTRDIMSGSNPPDVNAFSALQLLDERSKGRFIPVLQARADAYKQWYSIAIELEREFGPDNRTLAVMSSARSWTFKNFKRAQLSGSLSVMVESGSTQMKTSLGTRAALDHAVQMGFINPKDPDQNFEALKLMGLTKMAPSIDINVQSALQKQQAFENWAASREAQQQSAQQLQHAVEQQQQQIAQQMTAYKAQLAAIPPPTRPQPGQPPLPVPPVPQPPQTPPPPDLLQFTPLVWREWYNAGIHLQEFLKWANSDTIRQLVATNQAMVPLLEQHLLTIRQNMPAPPPAPAKVAYTFAGPDLADPQIREGYDRAAGLPPGDPSMTPPRVGTEANPQVVVSQPAKGGAMERSNNESTSMTEPMGFKETAQNHGPM